MIKLYNKLFLVLFYSLFLFSCNFSTDKNNQTIKDAVVVLSKACPIEIDYMTILDKVEYKSPKTIIFYCSANINLVKTDIEALEESIRSNVTYQILNNNNKNIKKLKDAGATFHYIYKTQAGKELLNIAFDPEFYSKHQDTPQDTLTNQELYKLLTEIADLQNTQLPRQLDEYSTLYKINALSPRTLEYIYRSEYTINDLDTTYFSSPEARQNILDDFDKTSNADRLLKDNKVIFRFTYEDKDGIYMSSLDITPKEYK